MSVVPEPSDPVPSRTPELPLPRGTVLLHVGPHKTGTTTLQGAFHTCRDAMEQHGAHYAGAGRQPMLAALAMTGRPGRRGDPTAGDRHWQDLVDEVAAESAAGKRVMVSSEFFADANDEVAADVVRGLGGERVHVVVTFRPLGKIMPSQWQQYVQNGLRMRYDDWLDHMLNKPPYIKPTTTFWHRHSQHRLVQRWAAAAGGAAHLTVVVLDESDRGMLLRAFEQMLDLPGGTLVPETDSGANRSLSYSEVEIVRRLNEEFRRRKWDDDVYGRYIRTGVVKKLLAQRRPAPDEPTIVTPRWAVERAAEIGAESAETIAAMGVNVVGDLAGLGAVPAAGIGDPVELPDDPRIAASAATIALVGTINAGRAAAKAEATAAEGTPEEAAPALADVDSRTLARVLAARVKGRAGDELRRQRRRARARRGR